MIFQLFEKICISQIGKNSLLFFCTVDAGGCARVLSFPAKRHLSEIAVANPRLVYPNPSPPSQRLRRLRLACLATTHKGSSALTSLQQAFAAMMKSSKKVEKRNLSASAENDQEEKRPRADSNAADTEPVPE